MPSFTYVILLNIVYIIIKHKTKLEMSWKISILIFTIICQSSPDVSPYVLECHRICKQCLVVFGYFKYLHAPYDPQHRIIWYSFLVHPHEAELLIPFYLCSSFDRWSSVPIFFSPPSFQVGFSPKCFTRKRFRT